MQECLWLAATPAGEALPPAAEWFYRLREPEFLVSIGVKAAYIICLALLFEVLVWAGNRVIDRLLGIRRFGAEAAVAAKRRRTVRGIARSAWRYLLYFMAGLLILEVMGVRLSSLTPLLGAAGVLGLALGFGAQKLVRDVITGFLLLLEGQYEVGDYVTIGNITGVVEEVGLRTTSIRDQAGKLHMLSNGDISSVCNQSRGGIKVAVELGLSPEIDLEQFQEVVECTGREMAAARQDLTEPPRLEGIAGMDGTKLIVRVTAVVTAPGEAAEMELRRRLLEALRERKIAVL